MINRGANPFVVNCYGNTQYELGKLSELNLENLSTKKSVYFSVQPVIGDQTLAEPWYYQSGVYPGDFDVKIGQGASGIVVSGQCQGKPAAFKFNHIGEQKFQQNTRDALATLNEKLGEMTSVQSISGSKIVRFFGHYR